jgi:3-mercaptopyruvate sulfurtransferase SseA
MAVISEVTTSELAGLKGRDEIKIIDVRPVDACNGWRMQNESRGGHIAGTKDMRIPNGGFQSRKDAGYEISLEDLPKKRVNLSSLNQICNRKHNTEE